MNKRKLLFMNLLFIASLSFSQSSVASKSIEKITTESKPCKVEDGFEEPKWNSTKIRTRNKTRVGDLKAYVSKDTGVNVDNIILLSFKDTAANGVYVLCVGGNEMKYIRTSAVFRKDGEGATIINGLNNN